MHQPYRRAFSHERITDSVNFANKSTNLSHIRRSLPKDEMNRDNATNRTNLKCHRCDEKSESG